MNKKELEEAKQVAWTSHKYGNSMSPDEMTDKELIDWYRWSQQYE